MTACEACLLFSSQDETDTACRVFEEEEAIELPAARELLEPYYYYIGYRVDPVMKEPT